ncbi:MAG: hypothetical protein ABH812_03415 [bacterium]
MFKKYFIYIIILIIAVITIYLSTYKQKSWSELKEKEEQIIGGDKDEGGCLIGAGYSWCEIKQECLREWEEPCKK